ncbi:MAG: M81 family metallopeptidase, partial [Sedimenticolaceae bacterium]
MNNKDNKYFTRRDFTKLAIAGGISVALPGYLLAQQEPKQQGGSYPKSFRNIHDKIRVSYVGFFHETNTYLTEGMGETTLDRMRTFRGDQIKKQLKGTAIGGAVDVCEEKGWELLPGV